MRLSLTTDDIMCQNNSYFDNGNMLYLALQRSPVYKRPISYDALGLYFFQMLKHLHTIFGATIYSMREIKAS